MFTPTIRDKACVPEGDGCGGRGYDLGVVSVGLDVVEEASQCGFEELDGVVL